MAATNLRGRHVVLGVTGSIAAYKAADVASRLVQAGARVEVILTPSAVKFVAPLTFQSLTGRPPVVDMYDERSPLAEVHVALARRADVILIAPATATMLARLAHGLADDPVSLTVLASVAPVVIAPAMDDQMYEAAVTQENVRRLHERGYVFVGPERGRLASGRSGQGRLSEPAVIVAALRTVLGRRGDMVGRKLVISAGGTREPIDPVRFVGNRSSGKMGYALAEAGRDRGASVTLVSAATGLPFPYGVDGVRVDTAAEMMEAVVAACGGADALVMAAAPADFRPARQADQKIKRQPGAGLTLALTQNDDILASVPGDLVKVGFAAESEDVLAHAGEKLAAKGLDLIVANDITESDGGFNSDLNRVVLIDRASAPEHIALAPKYDIAQRILDRVARLLDNRRSDLQEPPSKEP
ncbi:MAG: bifunctional phosphopantothenoylcysteine decarboxylase/phosphopantothenate--cysteine ligase CoaBC [Dehalococcoidia bacterium]|nr:bifunctional phosphopantothenoylcysteine decarboxylase/phosphopantothenate--cysteine ligase CoaBC [Dehalococcoidia bacterium]